MIHDAWKQNKSSFAIAIFCTGDESMGRESHLETVMCRTWRPRPLHPYVAVVIMIVALLTLLAPTFRLNDKLKVPFGIAAGFMGGALGGISAMSGPLVFTFLLAKGLRGKNFTKEASLFLVLSSALLTIFLSSSRVFDWRDIAISTVALAPVAYGMLLGQRLRDKIPADFFKAAVLIIVFLSGGGLLAKALFP